MKFISGPVISVSTCP